MNQTLLLIGYPNRQDGAKCILRARDCPLYPARKQRPSGVLGLFFYEFMEQQTTWPTSNHLLAFLLPFFK